MSYGTILFDLSEVIISGYSDYEKHVGKAHPEIPLEEIILVKKSLNKEFMDVMRGRVTEDAYFLHFSKALNGRVSANELKKLARMGLGAPLPGMLTLIEELSNKGYGLILVSDYVSGWLDYLCENSNAWYAVDDLFDELFFSFESGQLKQDPGTFESILHELWEHAESVLFIDDLPENIAAAENAGIESILFKNADALRRELTYLDIL